MTKETNTNLKAVKSELKNGGTYFDTLLEAAKKSFVEAMARSAYNISIEEAQKIGDDAARQFLGHWVGGEDAEVPDVDPNNPLQKSVDGTPAPILHPSKEDDHEIPAFVGKMKDGDVPAPPPGVPEAYTPEEEKAILHVTGTPENAQLMNDANQKVKEAEIPLPGRPEDKKDLSESKNTPAATKKSDTAHTEKKR